MYDIVFIVVSVTIKRNCRVRSYKQLLSLWESARSK